MNLTIHGNADNFRRESRSILIRRRSTTWANERPSFLSSLQFSGLRSRASNAISSRRKPATPAATKPDSRCAHSCVCAGAGAASAPDSRAGPEAGRGAAKHREPMRGGPPTPTEPRIKPKLTPSQPFSADPRPTSATWPGTSDQRRPRVYRYDIILSLTRCAAIALNRPGPPSSPTGA